MTLDELEKMKALQALKSDNATLGRVGTGLAQSLLSIGASPGVAVQAYQHAGEVAKAMAPAPVTSLKEVDVEGKPIYMTPDQAVGEQAFQALKTKTTDHPLKEFKNTKTKEKVVIKDTGTGYEDLSGKPISLSRDWVFSRQPKTATHTDFAGNKTTYIIDTDVEKDQSKPAISTKGIGSQMGEEGKPISTEEAKTRISSAKKGKDIIEKHLADEMVISSIEKDLVSTNDPMVFATALGKLQRLSVGENRLSDIEGARYMGNDYKDAITKASEWSKRFTGGIPDTVRSNIINLISHAKNKAAANKKAAMMVYGETSGLGKRGAESIQRISGAAEQKDQVQSSLKERLLRTR